MKNGYEPGMGVILQEGGSGVGFLGLSDRVREWEDETREDIFDRITA